MSDVNYKQLVLDILKEWSRKNPEHDLGRLIEEMEEHQKTYNEMLKKISSISERIETDEQEKILYDIYRRKFESNRNKAYHYLNDCRKKLGLDIV